jgi:hypothetical protein
MKKYFFISIIVSIIFYSCTEKINVKLPNSDKKIVIEGSIENGKYPEVIITNSFPLFSSGSGAAITAFYVTDAKVYVSNGFITDTLGLAIDSASSLGLVYKGKSILGMAGQSYTLKVVRGGKTYTAVTNIPSPIALDSVWWKAEPPEDTLGFANAHLTDPVGLGNNYKWYAKRPQDRRFIAPYGSTFDDKLIDGKSFEFAYSKGYDPTDTANTEKADGEKRRNYYLKTDTIYIKFCTMDRQSKDFYSTFEQAVSSNGNPFASPVTILSNIEGGALGVWSGFGVTYDTILPPH